MEPWQPLSPVGNDKHAARPSSFPHGERPEETAGRNLFAGQTLPGSVPDAYLWSVLTYQIFYPVSVPWIDMRNKVHE
jgi:hypothetical protein